jgi:hypothetical protein
MNYLLLITTLISAIKDIEALMPASAGKDKFDAAIALVQGVVGDVGPTLPALASIATNVVNALRKAGVFTHAAV